MACLYALTCTSALGPDLGPARSSCETPYQQGRDLLSEVEVFGSIQSAHEVMRVKMISRAGPLDKYYEKAWLNPSASAPSADELAAAIADLCSTADEVSRRASQVAMS